MEKQRPHQAPQKTQTPLKKKSSSYACQNSHLTLESLYSSMAMTAMILEHLADAYEIDRAGHKAGPPRHRPSLQFHPHHTDQAPTIVSLGIREILRR